jgi:DNA-binding NarL/FixJ family response regulator
MASRRRTVPVPWRAIAGYAALLAAGTALLNWLDWQRVARTAPGEVVTAMIALLFLALGVTVGWRLTRTPHGSFDGNPAAQAQLGISPRELEVLHALADGLANKEIARRLDVSPNTVKTHLARLFARLEASNRTDAINRARALGILR